MTDKVAAEGLVSSPASQKEAEACDEEMILHPFNAREESYGPSPHWCGDCEYHRDHQIHKVEVPSPASPKEPTFMQLAQHATDQGVTMDRTLGAQAARSFKAGYAAALAEVSSPARPNRFDCRTCGQGIAVDEDGCCRTCGADATAVLASSPARPPQLKDLITKWRLIGKGYAGFYLTPQARILEQCAAELEAALAEGATSSATPAGSEND